MCRHTHRHTQLCNVAIWALSLPLFLPPPGSITLFKVRTPRWCRSAITKTLMAAQMLSSRQSIPEKHSLNQPITFTQYCLHHTIRYGYSTNPTIAHCLPHTSCRLDVCFEIEWLDWYFSWKAFQTCTKKGKKIIMWALLALKIRLYVQRTQLWFKSVK